MRNRFISLHIFLLNSILIVSGKNALLTAGLRPCLIQGSHMRSAAFGSHTGLRWDSHPSIFDYTNTPHANYLSYAWIFNYEQSRKMNLFTVSFVTQVLLGMISL